MTDCLLRPAQAADAAALADIYAHYVLRTTVSFELTPPSPAEMLRRMQQVQGAGAPYLVAEQQGRLLGYAYAHPWKERPAYAHTWELTIYLRPEAVGQGVGTELCRRVVEECRAAGCHALVACITAENGQSLRFHSRLGFRRVSCFPQVGRKLGRWLDVVDMELLLERPTHGQCRRDDEHETEYLPQADREAEKNIIFALRHPRASDN